MWKFSYICERCLYQFCFLAPLAPPENLNYTDKTAWSISLQWEPPQEPFSELQEYVLTKVDQREPKGDQPVATTNTTTHTFIKLHPNREYVFQVQYIGKNNLESPLSKPLKVKTEISSKKICSLFLLEAFPCFLGNNFLIHDIRSQPVIQ